MEQQVPMTEQDWRVLLDRYTDGMFNSASPYRAAALAFKQMIAHAVWEEVRARKLLGSLKHMVEAPEPRKEVA